MFLRYLVQKNRTNRRPDNFMSLITSMDPYSPHWSLLAAHAHVFELAHPLQTQRVLTPLAQGLQWTFKSRLFKSIWEFGASKHFDFAEHFMLFLTFWNKFPASSVVWMKLQNVSSTLWGGESTMTEFWFTCSLNSKVFSFQRVMTVIKRAQTVKFPNP